MDSAPPDPGPPQEGNFARPIRAVAVLAVGLAFGVLALPALEHSRLVAVLEPLQRPLRIAQSWNLYGRGPKKVKRFELAVDGVVRYRSNDPEAAFLAPLLRYRRIRPIVTALCGDRSEVRDAFVAFVADQVWADDPAARHLTVRCTVSPWPGDAPHDATVIEVDR
ncbi:MAG: hypothetical protein ABMB14_13890 [Myxococcota bacterium]